MFLTPDEIAELTGLKRPRAQVFWLRANGWPVETDAAGRPKRLRGFMWRNGIADPIGDQDRVYGWSCRALAAKLAASSRENERE